MATATMAIRLDEAEKHAIQDYAFVMGMSASEFARRAMLEKIEDELDYRIGVEALEEFEKNPVTHSSEEVMRELGMR